MKESRSELVKRVVAENRVNDKREDKVMSKKVMVKLGSLVVDVNSIKAYGKMDFIHNKETKVSEPTDKHTWIVIDGVDGKYTIDTPFDSVLDAIENVQQSVK